MWSSQPMRHPRARETRPTTLAKLRRGAAERQLAKWKDVRGPTAAAQASLLQIGWDPQSHDAWSRPLPSGTIDGWLAFVDDCAQLQWKEAAHHEAGEDLAAGADMKTAQIELSRLAAQSKFDEWWAADVAFISGGQWTRERQIAAGCARSQH
eukprot:442172-Pyramimonas_sp.AAC.1